MGRGAGHFAFFLGGLDFVSCRVDLSGAFGWGWGQRHDGSTSKKLWEGLLSDYCAKNKKPPDLRAGRAANEVEKA